MEFVAIAAAFGAGFYFGAWCMYRLAIKAVDRAFDELEAERR